MAIQVIGNGGTIIGAGEEARKPLHVANVPFGTNHYRYAGFTGTIAAATAAGAELLQFRFVASTKTFALIHKVVFDGLGIVAVSTALGPVGFNLIIARAWTVAGSGGTRIAVSGDNLQMETSIANSQVNDIGISTTAGLTVGTKSLDANSVGQAIGGIGSALITSYGTTSIVSPQPLFNSDGSMLSPIKLANNEGFVIRTTHVGPAGLTYTAGFTISWSEVTDM